jgi:hypothetical protein
MTPADLEHLDLGRVLDLLHADGRREVFRGADGQTWLLHARATDDAAQTALKLVHGLSDYLAPWCCPWCGGRSSVPGACDACHAALRHYVRAGARFAPGAAAVHAFRDWQATSCGLVLTTLPPRRPLALAEVPSGTLCRNCLRSLRVEYDAHTAAQRHRDTTRRGPHGE